jgi:hypothetical protein
VDLLAVEFDFQSPQSFLDLVKVLDLGLFVVLFRKRSEVHQRTVGVQNFGKEVPVGKVSLEVIDSLHTLGGEEHLLWTVAVRF